MGRILATADIGSNTVHLLVAEVNGATLSRLENRTEWIALGETVTRLGHIPPDQATQLINAIKNFKRAARSLGAEFLYVFATEAMRAAANHDQILERIRETAEVTVEIISTRREAELSLRGVLLDSPPDMDLVLEVGGGSAQIGRVENGHLLTSDSAPIGTGRLVALAGLKNPSSAHAVRTAQEIVHNGLRNLTPAGYANCAVASGGVIRGIWRALHPDGEHGLHRKEIEYMEWVSARQPVTRLLRRFSVKPKRAGTLLPGAIVYRGLMERFELAEIHISEFGVREGALIEFSRGEIQGCLI
jgi:exopolyphosphatase/guanosine-5'-triphosphate,3'-diphosphate pyrophosphatase